MEEREKVRLEIQERVDAGKTQAERNRLGQFATPPTLASSVPGGSAAALFFSIEINCQQGVCLPVAGDGGLEGGADLSYLKNLASESFPAKPHLFRYRVLINVRVSSSS